jgi:hypothetical protein
MTIDELPVWVYLILHFFSSKVEYGVSSLQYWQTRRSFMGVIQAWVKICLHPESKPTRLQAFLLSKVEQWADRELELCEAWLGLIESTGLIASGMIHA